LGKKEKRPETEKKKKQPVKRYRNPLRDKRKERGELLLKDLLEKNRSNVKKSKGTKTGGVGVVPPRARVHSPEA